MHLREILGPTLIVTELEGSTKREILENLAAPLTEGPAGLDQDTLVAVLLKREADGTTAIADGIALPHGRLTLGDEVDEVLATFGRAREGLDFDSVDGRPTKLFFLLVSPEGHPSIHMRWLAHIAVLLKNPELRTRLAEAETAEEALAALEAEEEAQAAQQP